MNKSILFANRVTQIHMPCSNIFKLSLKQSKPQTDVEKFKTKKILKHNIHHHLGGSCSFIDLRKQELDLFSLFPLTHALAHLVSIYDGAKGLCKRSHKAVLPWALVLR